jgi:hypothetical protein
MVTIIVNENDGVEIITNIRPYQLAVRDLIHEESEGSVISHFTNVMNASVKFKAFFMERVATSTNLIMLFQNQHTLSRSGQQGSSNKSADARPYHDRVKLTTSLFQLFGRVTILQHTIPSALIKDKWSDFFPGVKFKRVFALRCLGQSDVSYASNAHGYCDYSWNRPPP